MACNRETFALNTDAWQVRQSATGTPYLWDPQSIISIDPSALLLVTIFFRQLSGGGVVLTPDAATATNYTVVQRTDLNTGTESTAMITLRHVGTGTSANTAVRYDVTTTTYSVARAIRIDTAQEAQVNVLDTDTATSGLIQLNGSGGTGTLLALTGVNGRPTVTDPSGWTRQYLYTSDSRVGHAGWWRADGVASASIAYTGAAIGHGHLLRVDCTSTSHMFAWII